MPKRRDPPRPEPQAAQDIQDSMSLTLRPPAPLDDAAFDAWLRGALTEIYGEVAAEPVPERLLRLIRARD
jgi:hypothetical protein